MTQPADARSGGAPPQAGPAVPEHRWLILGVIALAQLMIVLDATIMNIALPTAQQDLGFSIVDRQWVVTAYALAFGSLLLLGGKLADVFGRKVTFLAGLIGFAVASAAGGAAANFGMLVAARMWWCASIAQCPRSRSASRAGRASSNGRLVMA